MASLYVYMNGYEVGEYIQHKSGAQEFIYSDSWLDHGDIAIPLSLSIPLTEKKHKGDTVYNYFENLLPDSKDIRRRIQARLGAKTEKPFDLLSFIGKDCVGAIQLMTEQVDVDIKKISGTPLSENEIAEELKNYETLPLGMSKDNDFRISLAGAQEKTALLWHKKKWQRPTGTTPTTHIFKLPIGKIEHSGIDLSDSVENEWLCMEILRAFGLPVANVRIEKFKDIKVLVVERFDRELAEDKSWIIRLPQEDMCQANAISPGLKYESDGGPGISTIMELLKSSVQPEEDRKQFMHRVFLFWLLGAIDGHAKNFSIFLKQGGRFCLTPVYHVISAYPLAVKRQIEFQNMKMAMALRSKNTHYDWHYMMPRNWFNQSKKVDFPETTMKDIIDESISEIDGVITQVSSRLPDDFPKNISDPIFENMKTAASKF
ncbi:MAG: type II toxin-antitoxin system HipA family toxin [Proteobacteria bacterium]|nr:type II toxin-antitoxin system HipA family toxin [Pseudomonadota bacterium]NOG60066.1 type II toxin-antitoxin system HipA family toxin [Pseudomonadota bacterium]